MRRGRLLALALLALLAVAAPSDAAAGPPIRVVNLELQGEPGWRAENRFDLSWDLAAPAGAAPLGAVNYRLRPAGGGPALVERLLPPAAPFSSLTLPTGGAFLAEIWAVDSGGQAGPAASVALLLDRERPGPTAPLPPAGWTAGGEATHLRLTPPPGAAPPSGLRGYAVSVDADPDGSPCASAETCAGDEVDLRGGVGDNSLVLTGLPEGRLYIHAVAVSGTGMRSAQIGTAPLRIDSTPPRLALEGVPAGWANGPVRLRASAADELSGMGDDGLGGAYTTLVVDGGTPRLVPGDTATAIVAGDGLHRVEAYARDLAGNLSSGGTRQPLSGGVRIDGSAPRVAFANRREAGERQTLVATVADPLSGPSPSRGGIGFRPARTRQRFAPLPTSVSGDRLVAEWDGSEHPAGTYEFEATAYDRAGNVAASTARADGTEMLAVGLGRARTRLRAWLGRGAASGRSLPLGRGAQLSGRLTTANGRPLAGLEVEVRERFDPGAAVAQRRTPVRTGPGGRFAVPLPAGPSRRVELAFAGERGLAASAARALRLEARAGVAMRASSRVARVGGRPLTFRGRVLAAGAALPRKGIPVELQFRLPGLPWSEFRTVTSDRHGRFRYRYAFADDDSRGANFQFRALVPERDNWPYAPGTSRPVTVTGR